MVASNFILQFNIQPGKNKTTKRWSLIFCYPFIGWNSCVGRQFSNRNHRCFILSWKRRKKETSLLPLLKQTTWVTVRPVTCPSSTPTRQSTSALSDLGSLSDSSNSHYNCYVGHEWTDWEPIPTSLRLLQQPRNRPFCGVTCSLLLQDPDFHFLVKQNSQ